MREIKELISKPVTTIFLFLAMCITIFSLDTVVQVIGSSYERETIEDRFYEKHVSISFNNEDFNEILNSDYEYILNHIDISKSFGNGVSKLKLFGINKYNEFQKFFNTKTGVYFNEKDYESGNDVAIIGSSAKKFTYQKDGKEYIKIKDKEYKVLDYLEDKKNSQWRHAILVPSKAVPKDLYKDNTINIFKGKSIENEISELNEKFTDIKVNMYTFDKKSELIKVINFDSSILKDLFLLTALGAVNIIIATLFWTKAIYNEILIKVTIGADMFHIFKEVLYKLSIINILALTSSILISRQLIPIIGKTYFIPVNYNIYTTYIVFLLSLIMTLIIACISIYIFYKGIKKKGIVYYEK